METEAKVKHTDVKREGRKYQSERVNDGEQQGGNNGGSSEK